MLPLSLENVVVSYPGLATSALDIPALRIEAEECIAVTGPSGSGKTTFANVITGLVRPDRGRVVWGVEDIAALAEAKRDLFRAETIGLVLQEFHLFPGLSALDNVLLPARLRRVASAATIRQGAALLDRVGIICHAQGVETMSRGEMQRVAVARALLRQPKVLVADEPTASLDPENGAQVIDLLVSLARETGAMLIAISHDDRLIERMDRELRLTAGRLDGKTKPSLAA
jgi:putative ABC transport system ATP-binding protein